jgi:hypothetical protein
MTTEAVERTIVRSSRRRLGEVLDDLQDIAADLRATTREDAAVLEGVLLNAHAQIASVVLKLGGAA